MHAGDLGGGGGTLAGTAEEDDLLARGGLLERKLLLEASGLKVLVERFGQAREGEVDGGGKGAKRDLVGFTDVDDQNVLKVESAI